MISSIPLLSTKQPRWISFSWQLCVNLKYTAAIMHTLMRSEELEGAVRPHTVKADRKHLSVVVMS